MRSLVIIASLLLAACGDPIDDGEPGPPAPAMPSGLARVDDEPAGANCAGGGAAIRTGLDDDGDGVLDADEVDATRYVCDGETWRGDFGVEQWKDPAAVAALRRARAVTGYLALGENADLPRLEVVGGQLGIGGQAPVTLPSLWLVGGDLVLAGSQAEVRLPALATVGGQLSVFFRASIGALALPALTRVDGDVAFTGRLGRADLPALASIGGLLKVWSAGLSELRLEGLRSIGGDLQLERVPDLHRLDLPALVAVAGELSISHWEGAVPLEAISAPQLTQVASLRLSGAPRLAVVDLSSLQRVDGDVRVQSVPALAQLRMPLTTVGTPEHPATLVISGSALEVIDLPLTRVDRTLEVFDNAALRTIQLDALEHVDTVEIGGSPHLQRVAVPRVETFGALRMSSAPELVTLALGASSISTLLLDGLGLVDLSGLPALRSVGRGQISNLPHLRALTGTPLTSVTSLEILNDDALTSLAGLEQLTTVAYRLGLEDDGGLADLSALRALTSLGDQGGHDGAIGIVDCDALVSLHGLEGLTRIGEWLHLQDNARLADLTALGHVTDVGIIQIVGNPALTSLAGLEHIEEASDDVSIYGDNGLTSLDGLAGLRSVAGGLLIAEQVHLDHVGLTALRWVGGRVNFEANAAAVAAELDALRAQLGRPAAP